MSIESHSLDENKCIPETVLFNTSILENLIYGCNEHPDSQTIERAIELANLETCNGLPGLQ